MNRTISEKFTCVIYCNSKNIHNYYDCVGSIFSAEVIPYRIILGISEYTKEYDPLFDTQELRNLELVKLNSFMPLNTFRRFALQNITSDYTIFLEDDTVLVDENFLQVLLEQHETNSVVLMSDKYSAFSIATDMMCNMIDGNYAGAGYEDLDLHYQMKLLKIPFIKLDPYLFRHKRLDLLPDAALIEQNAKLFSSKYSIPLNALKPFHFSMHNENMFR